MIPLIDQKATGLRLKELMEKNGYTVTDLRKYLSLACPQSVYHWFSGKSLPSLENFYALGELFHVSIDSMLRDEVALDENIVSNEKSDVGDIGQKNYRHNLVSAIMWAFGAVFFLFGGLLEKKIVYVAVGFLYLTFSCSYFYNVLKERDE